MKNVATQQEAPPPLLPLVVPRGSPTTEKDVIWLLWKSGMVVFEFGVQGFKGSGPEPEPARIGPDRRVQELESWIFRFRKCEVASQVGKEVCRPRVAHVPPGWPGHVTSNRTAESTLLPSLSFPAFW